MKKKRSRLFRHFIAILNMLACSIPIVVLGIIAIDDALPKYFNSVGIQHNSNDTTTFDDNLDYLDSRNQLNSIETNLMQTLDKMGYFVYGTGVTTLEQFETLIASKTYKEIVAEDCNTHLIINSDFIGLFIPSCDIPNNNNSVSIYLFINYFLNYLLNITLIIFIPEFIFIFIDFVRNICYKITEVKEGD